MKKLFQRALLASGLLLYLTISVNAQPTKVQVGTAPPIVGTSISVVFPGTTTNGNLLVVFDGVGQFGCPGGCGGGPRTVSAPGAGWTRRITDTQTFDSIGVWYCTVGGAGCAAGTTYVFTVSEGSEFSSATGIEVSGADNASPFDNAAISTITKSASTSSLATVSVTPSVIGCLAVTGLVQDNNGTSDIATAGWTRTVSAVNGNGRSSAMAERDTLTSDTTTAITSTWTVGGGPTEALSALVLIKPGGGPPPSAPNTRQQMIVGSF
jgi:hypothetical protein